MPVLGMVPQYYTVRIAGIAGRLGCKHWVALVLRVAKDGNREIFIQFTYVSVLYTDPRLLIICNTSD